MKTSSATAAGADGAGWLSNALTSDSALGRVTPCGETGLTAEGSAFAGVGVMGTGEADWNPAFKSVGPVGDGGGDIDLGTLALIGDAG